MKLAKIHRSIFASILPIGILLLAFTQWPSKDESHALALPTAIAHADKQKGAHVFGPSNTAHFETLGETNVEWITLVPWGHQEDFDSPEVGTRHDRDSSQIRASDARWVDKITSARDAGFKVFLKPHLWIFRPSDGKWRSDVYPSSDENWELWKTSYCQFILRYARIAEQTHAEMFCIGVEFTKLTAERPEFWSGLIEEVRNVYSGKITYAANWYHEYEAVSFWDELDYIGIQAYFPLTENMYPSVDQVSEGWNQHIPALEATHKKHNRQIIFTEMGYRSTATCAIKPWEWIENTSVHDNPYSVESQANCYQAFFNTVWKKDWMAGVHIWQLRSDHAENTDRSDLDFTPQGKPAEGVIAKGFE